MKWFGKGKSTPEENAGMSQGDIEIRDGLRAAGDAVAEQVAKGPYDNWYYTTRSADGRLWKVSVQSVREDEANE